MGNFECCFCGQYTSNASKIVGIWQICIDESRENILFQNVRQSSSAKNDYGNNCLFDMMKFDS